MYKLVRIEEKIIVIVIGAREDDEVYEFAHKRIRKHGL